MTELEQLLEWIGMGMIGMIIVAVIIMMRGLWERDQKDRDYWD